MLPCGTPQLTVRADDSLPLTLREPRVGPSELQTRSSHLYFYISDGVRHDVIQ